jgi:NAD(P)-dependent dehydrogenase (short-subunit alcohol dehydrogenase family)
VIISSRREEGLSAAQSQINADHPAAVFSKTCHMGDEEQIIELFEWAEATVGIPDILVNNAGTNPYFGPMLSTDRGAWDKTFDVNLRGPFLATRQFATRLVAAAMSGSVINITSILGQGASPLQGVYGMTKAAMISMTRTLAVELGGHNIRVNAIAPGLIETKLSSILTSTPALLETFTQRTPLGRVGQPQELAGAAVLLASEESRYITGQTINVDGGYIVG